MLFEQGHLYHIFNQGNNRQQIFFTKENYLYFFEKIKKYVLPYSDVLAWCLMPNHFHLMVHVNNVSVSLCESSRSSVGVTSLLSRVSHPDTSFSDSTNTKRTFNESIGIMLRSYTRAINKQEIRTGALFREETKAICLTQNHKITQSWFTAQGVTQVNVQHPELQYPNICFNYINFNPVKDGLVKQNADWEFSSYRQIAGLQTNGILNNHRIKEFGLEII
jgi:putative transposase